MFLFHLWYVPQFMKHLISAGKRTTMVLDQLCKPCYALIHPPFDLRAT